jgi:hypothetical protein
MLARIKLLLLQLDHIYWRNQLRMIDLVAAFTFNKTALHSVHAMTVLLLNHAWWINLETKWVPLEMPYLMNSFL